LAPSRYLAALSTFLGDKEYFFSQRPSELDATAYGLPAQGSVGAGCEAHARAFAADTKPPAFCERVRRAYYDGREG